MKQMIRTLRADEIECRVGTISDKGLSLLLYKNARVDQQILDEVFGITGWSRKHEKIGDAIYCTISIKDERGDWVSKQDVGNESYADAVKGAASDSFKRAAFNIGIGRELYTAPFIWISADKVDIRQDGKRYYTKDHFKVTHIEYDDLRNISGIQIQNQKSVLVYTYQVKVKGTEPVMSKLNERQIQKLHEEMERTGVKKEEIMKRYRLSDWTSMSELIYQRVIQALEKTENAVA